jgi:hypothetical protein
MLTGLLAVLTINYADSSFSSAATGFFKLYNFWHNSDFSLMKEKVYNMGRSGKNSIIRGRWGE